MKKISLALVLMLLTSGIIAQEEPIKEVFIKETRIEAPVFKGYTVSENYRQQALNQYLQQELSYLSDFDFLTDEGIVSIQFTVDSDGSVKDAFIDNSVNDILDNAVLKAIKNSNMLWQAGKVNGLPSAMEKTVFVKFDIPGNASHNEIAIDYMTKAVRQIDAIEHLQDTDIDENKIYRKTTRKANRAENNLVNAEKFNPGDLSITFWQAKVYEIQGRTALMQQKLDKYLELVTIQQLEEELLNTYDMAVITLK